ncbi:MAG: hotdog fold thioesterase, partial [Saprospiraceae bacterium]|nr:hotdog fold thioesterase [Saprospiraceae bacterium]
SHLMLGDLDKQAIVGIEINANHLSAVRSGFVEAVVRPIRIGRTVQVWDILITQASKKICISRLTTMTINKKQ